MSRCILIEGEAFLTARVVAESFEVEVRWVTEVCSRGFVEARDWEGELCILASALDQLAQVRRWSLLGLDWDAIDLMLDPG